MHVVFEEWDAWGEQNIGSNHSKPDAWNNNMHMEFDTDGMAMEGSEEEEDEEDSDYSFTEDFMALSSGLSRAERLRAGHNLTTMLIGCTFLGMKCKAA